MIKLNLNKTKSGKEHTLSFQDPETGLASSGSTIVTQLSSFIKEQSFEVTPDVLFRLFLKLLLLVSFPLGLKYYEFREISKLKVKKETTDQLLDQTNQRLSGLKTQLGAYGDLQDLSREFSQRRDFLQRISSNRLIVPRALELIQTKLPESVWLKSINIKLSTEDEAHRVVISGEGYRESNVNFFAISLKEILNENTITVDTNDIRAGSSDSILKVGFILKGTM